MFSMVLVGSGSISFDTDPDSGSSHFLIRIWIQGNDTDSTDLDPPHCLLPLWPNWKYLRPTYPVVFFYLLSYRSTVVISVSDPYSSNSNPYSSNSDPDPAKNLNPDPEGP